MIPLIKTDRSEVTSLLFPDQSKVASPCPANAEDICLETDPGIHLHCRYYCKEQDAPVLIYYPATNVSAYSFDTVANSYLKHGMNVFLISYRGCGINSGLPSIGAMQVDSGKLFHLAIEWLRGKGCSGPFFVMGQSLGSICAIETVSKNGDVVKGLIIESGICSTVSFLEAMGISDEDTDILGKDAFDNIEIIEKIKTPTLIFHGARDGLVAVKEAEKLQASSGARTKQFFIIPGAGHYTVAETGGDLYFKTIKQFTDTVCGVNTWRHRRKNHRRSKEG